MWSQPDWQKTVFSQNIGGRSSVKQLLCYSLEVPPCRRSYFFSHAAAARGALVQTVGCSCSPEEESLINNYHKWTFLLIKCHHQVITTSRSANVSMLTSLTWMTFWLLPLAFRMAEHTWLHVCSESCDPMVTWSPPQVLCHVSCVSSQPKSFRVCPPSHESVQTSDLTASYPVFYLNGLWKRWFLFIPDGHTAEHYGSLKDALVVRSELVSNLFRGSVVRQRTIIWMFVSTC